MQRRPKQNGLPSSDLLYLITQMCLHQWHCWTGDLIDSDLVHPINSFHYKQFSLSAIKINSIGHNPGPLHIVQSVIEDNAKLFDWYITILSAP